MQGCRASSSSLTLTSSTASPPHMVAAQFTNANLVPLQAAIERGRAGRALSAVLGQPLPFNSLQELRAKMFADHPHLALLDMVEPADAGAIAKLAAAPVKVGKDRFGLSITDYYLTNPVARASAIMGRLSAMHADGPEKATGTDG